MAELFNNYRDVVGIMELQQMLGCGRNTAYSLVKSNQIKAIRIGRTYKIPKCNIIAFIQQKNNQI